MRGVLNLHIKQYGESRLSILNGSPEFLHIVTTFVTLHYEQFGESQFSVLNPVIVEESVIFKLKLDFWYSTGCIDCVKKISDNSTLKDLSHLRQEI